MSNADTHTLGLVLDSTGQRAALDIWKGSAPRPLTRFMPIERARELARRIQARANRQGGVFTLDLRREVARTF